MRPGALVLLVLAAGAVVPVGPVAGRRAVGQVPAASDGQSSRTGQAPHEIYLPNVRCARTPAVVGRIDIEAFTAVAVGDSGLAYVASRGAANQYRILAADVTDPAAPRVVGASELAAHPVSALTSEGRRLFAFGEHRPRSIAVYDLGVPETPRRVGDFQPTGMSPESRVNSPRAMDVYRGFLYWTGCYDPTEPAWDAGESSAFVADLSDPALPVQHEGVGRGPAHDLLVHQGFLYLATVLDHQVHVLSLADPARPREVASVPALGVGGLRGDVRLAASGHHLFAVSAWTGLYEEGRTGVRVMDVSEPEQARVIADGGPLPWAGIGPVVAADGVLFAGFGLRGGVLSIDVSAPARPALVSSLDMAAGADHMALAADGRHLLVLEENVGLHSLRWSPPQLDAVGLLRGFWPTKAGDVSSDSAYAANGYGVSIIDVTQRSHPREVSFVDLDGEALWVRSRESELLVAASPYLRSSLRLHRIDVSDPASPRVVGSDMLDGARMQWEYPPLLDVAGDVLWAVDEEAGLTAYDIRDIDSVRVIGRLDLGLAEAQGGWLHGFALGDGLAFASYGKPSSCGLLVGDVSDPIAPRWIGRTPLSACWAGHVAVGNAPAAGGLVYAGAADPVVAYDVGDPFSPRERARVVTGQGNIGSMLLAGHRLHVAGCGAQLRIVDVADPDRPRMVGALAVDLATRVAAVDGEYVYLVGPNDNLADPDVGFLVVDPDPWSHASPSRR